MKKTAEAVVFSFVAVVATVMVVGGCAGLPSANDGAETGVFSRLEQNSDKGGMELVLFPVAVWGEKEASAPVAAEVGGREVYVRKRRGRFLDRPRVKMGLFWNTRGDEVYLLVAVSGPPARIDGVEISYDGGAQILARANNVRLLPGRNFWDGGDGKTPDVFAMTPSVFADLLASPRSRVAVSTSGGVLELDLGALQRDAPQAMRENAKVLFWQFHERMEKMQKQ